MGHPLFDCKNYDTRGADALGDNCSLGRGSHWVIGRVFYCSLRGWESLGTACLTRLPWPGSWLTSLVLDLPVLDIMDLHGVAYLVRGR